MPREAGNRGKPDIARPIFGIRGALQRRKGEEGGFFPVCFFLEIFGNAERSGDEGRSVALRIGGRRDIFLELVAGERRVEHRRKDRRQRDQHQEDLGKAAMEAGLAQDEPLSTR